MMENINRYIAIANLLISAGLAIFVVFLKNGFDKKMKKFTLVIAELSELNTKIHDCLVDSEELIKKDKNITDHIKKRLRYSASRLFKYDSVLKKDILRFIDGWENKTLDAKKLITLIGKIKRKVDNLILSLG